MESELKLSEIEFISQDEQILMIPNFQAEEMEFISGNYGPFEPLTPIEVPLWLAMSFRKNKMCKISPPNWLNIGRSKAVLIQIID
jgi:GINS complex subunit 2